MSNSNPHFSCPWDDPRDPGFLEGGKIPIFSNIPVRILNDETAQRD
jgi:hypothetical protein